MKVKIHQVYSIESYQNSSDVVVIEDQGVTQIDYTQELFLSTCLLWKHNSHLQSLECESDADIEFNVEAMAI